MNTILVSGSKGFIGGHLLKRLKELGHAVVEFEGDITDKAAYQKYDGLGITHCFHLAGKSFVPDSWDNPDRFIRVNVYGTGMLLDFCKKNSVRLTFISSYLYGAPKQLPIRETHPVQPNNPYALSKKLAEDLCEFYSRYYNVNITVIRPFNVYGPGQDPRFLVPSLIGQFTGESAEVHVKDLSPKRDYIYISDLVDALVSTLNTSERFLVLNAGSGYSLSVSEVIDEIIKITRSKKKVVSSNETRINEIPDTIADITEIKKQLGWSPKVSFHEGLSQIIDSLK